MTIRLDIPTLTTPRLVLRGFRAEDWDDYGRLNADPAFRRFLGDGTVLSRNEAWTQM